MCYFSGSSGLLRIVRVKFGWISRANFASHQFFLISDVAMCLFLVFLRRVSVFDVDCFVLFGCILSLCEGCCGRVFRFLSRGGGF